MWHHAPVSRRPRAARSRALALCLGLLVAGGIAESGARWWHAHPRLPDAGEESAPRGMFVASQTMGVQLAPSFSYPTERFSTNSLGLRDRERSTDPATGPRVALLGDSFTAGVGVDDRHHSAALLEGALDGVEVWNLGTPHFGLEQSWHRLEEAWPIVKPDVVVLQVFPGNDPWDDLRGPGFLRIVDGMIASAGWAPSGSPLDPLRPDLHRPLFAHHLPGDGPLWRHSHAYRAALGALSALLARFADDYPWGLEPFEYEAFGAVAWLYLEPPPPPVVGAWEVSAAALTRLRDFVQGEGSRLLLVAVPARIEVDESDLDWALEGGWDSGSRTGGGSVDGRRRFDPELPQRTLAALAASLDLPLLDLRPAFREANREERMHYLDDSHWTAGGHREAARAAGRFLADQGVFSLPPDFDQRLDAAVPEASFDVEFEGGFRPEDKSFEDGDGSQVGGVRGDGEGPEDTAGSEIPARLAAPRDLIPLLPEAPEGWTRSAPTARVTTLPFPRDDVLVAEATATYTDPQGRPHRVLALDGAGQPEIDQWFRDLGPRALPGPVPPGILPTAARVGVVLPETAPELADGVDRVALEVIEARLHPRGQNHPTLTIEDQESGGGPPRAARKRLHDPAVLAAALPDAPAGWEVLDTMPMYRPHGVPEFLQLPRWMEDLLNASPDVAGHNEQPWTAQIKRWYRGPEGSFALVVQDTGFNELLLRSRQKRLVGAWGPNPGAEDPAASTEGDPRVRRWQGAGLRGFRACRSEAGLCKVVVPLVDPADPKAPLARYNAILMGPPGASDAAYEALIAAIPRSALP